MKVTNLSVHKAFWLILTFFPIFSLSATESQIIMNALLVGGVLFSVAIFQQEIKPRIKRDELIVIVFFILIFAYFNLVSMLNSGGVSLASIADLSRPILYLVYFSFPLLCRVNLVDFNRLLKFILLLLIFQIIFSMLVWFEVLYPLVDIYKGRQSDDSVAFHFFRFSGTFIYPSDFGFFLSFFIYFYAAKYFVGYLTNGEKILLVGIIYSLVMTISRGAIYSILPMLVVMICFLSLRHKVARFKLFLSILIISATTLFLILRYSPTDVMQVDSRFSYLFSVVDTGSGVDSSTGHRIRELLLSFEVANDSFPIGIGPDRGKIAEHLNSVESFYGHNLIKWGYLGLLMMLAFFTYSIVFIIKGLKLFNRYETHYLFLIAVLASTVSVPLIFGWSSAVSDRFKLLPTFYVLLGYSFSLINYKIAAAQTMCNPPEKSKQL